MATGPEFAACSAAGSHWRGKDCDETRGDVYPGRKSSAYNASVDHNCNGIYGTGEVLARDSPPSQFEPGCAVKRKALSRLEPPLASLASRTRKRFAPTRAPWA